MKEFVWKSLRNLPAIDEDVLVWMKDGEVEKGYRYCANGWIVDHKLATTDMINAWAKLPKLEEE